MDIYQVKPDYCDEAIIKPQKLEVMELNGKRHYQHPETLKWLTSNTTMLSAVMPSSPYLTDWKIEKGKEEAERLKMHSAHYGTMMHIHCTLYLLHGKVNIFEAMSEYCKKKELNIKDFNAYELKKDLLSFIQFVKEKNITKLACEYPCYNDNFAGTIDLICQMTFNKKRIIALIDYKSGRKGFYESHRVQLHGYKIMLEQMTGLKVDKLFNFAPKNWDISPTLEPTFSFQNQSDEVYGKQWLLYSELYLLELQKKKDNTIEKIELGNIITDDFNSLLTVSTYEVANGL